MSRPASSDPRTATVPAAVTTPVRVTAFAARPVTRRGVAASVVRIMPEPYSPLMTSTARMATSAWPSPTPVRLSFVVSSLQPAASHVVKGVLASRRDEVAQKGIDLAEHLAPAVTVGDPGLIESLVANLVDNAIRHNHPDGHVEITTQTSGTEATLTVTNSGPVIPNNQIQRLFQPFQRLAPDRHGRRDGNGLGLAIVNAVTQAHHATLTATARPQGGLTITVRFTPPPQPSLVQPENAA